MGSLQIFCYCFPTHFFPLFFLLNLASDAQLHSLHPPIPWQHELSLSVTVTWASNSPHITAGFDWPGLSRSASRCLIITLFDCWSRDVIDWSTSPVWGQASEVAFTCVCGCVCVGFCGGGYIVKKSLRYSCTYLSIKRNWICTYKSMSASTNILLIITL